MSPSIPAVTGVACVTNVPVVSADLNSADTLIQFAFDVTNTCTKPIAKLSGRVTITDASGAVLYRGVIRQELRIPVGGTRTTQRQDAVRYDADPNVGDPTVGLVIKRVVFADGSVLVG